MDTGLKIRQLRQVKKLTSTEFAALIGISRPTLHSWEEGKVELKRAQLAKVAAALNVSVNEILQKDEALEINSLSWYQEQIEKLTDMNQRLVRTVESLSLSLGKPDGRNMLRVEKGSLFQSVAA